MLPLFACSRDSGWDETSRQLHRLAGSNAVDCGYVRLGADKTPAQHCVQTAQEDDRPFTVAYELRARDSRLIEAIVYTPDGRYFLVKHNSEGWDPNSLQRNQQLLGKMLVTACAEPPDFAHNAELTCK